MGEDFKALLKTNRRLSNQLRNAMGQWNHYKTLADKLAEDKTYLIKDNYRLEKQLSELMEELINAKHSK